MKTLKEQKNEIRAKYKEMRKNMDHSLKKDYDSSICRCILELASFRYADILLLYSPLKGEVDILPIINESLKQGKKVAFPKCDSEFPTMTFHYINNLSQLKPGAMGILEPTADLSVYSFEDSITSPTLCLVPALVYDKNGYRLGYGKGYYDRFLPKYKGASIGLIYNDFILEALPQGKYDLCVDALVTEKGVKPVNAD